MGRPWTDGALHRLIRLDPHLVAIVLMALWAFILAVLMWRNSSRGLLAHPE